MTVTLEKDQLEYIQKNNIDLSALVKEKLDKLIFEDIKIFPSIVYDKTHDILYVDFCFGFADTEFITDGCYVRRDTNTKEVMGFHIEDFYKKTNYGDFRKRMLEKLKEEGLK